MGGVMVVVRGGVDGGFGEWSGRVGVLFVSWPETGCHTLGGRPRGHKTLRGSWLFVGTLVVGPRGDGIRSGLGLVVYLLGNNHQRGSRRCSMSVLARRSGGDLEVHDMRFGRGFVGDRKMDLIRWMFRCTWRLSF